MRRACYDAGVAALTYHPLEKTDLSKYARGEPKHLWKKLQSSQKASLRRVAYEMAEGDMIHAKQGPVIVGRGTVELKICDGVGAARSIRKALGQVLEYNHYPSREAADRWLIVLDEEPCESDKLYIRTLREKLSMPITIGWRSGGEFSFHPNWSA
jgi:hypothetical protein